MRSQKKAFLVVVESFPPKPASKIGSDYLMIAQQVLILHQLIDFRLGSSKREESCLNCDVGGRNLKKSSAPKRSRLIRDL